MNRKEQIIYIGDNVNELQKKDRIEILSMIEKNKVVEKNNGSQVAFKNINDDTLKKIYNFVKLKR
jgi:hypothetical protein